VRLAGRQTSSCAMQTRRACVLADECYSGTLPDLHVQHDSRHPKRREPEDREASATSFITMLEENLRIRPVLRVGPSRWGSSGSVREGNVGTDWPRQLSLVRLIGPGKTTHRNS